MRTMTLGMMIGLIAAVFVPSVATADLSACDPTFAVCAGDGSYSWGDCNTGYEYGYDYVSASTPAGYAYASGSSFCGFGFTQNSFFVYTYGPAGFAYVSYYDYSYGSFSYCDTYAYSSATGYQSVGCPAGPLPNPGWGTLTP